MLSKRKETRGRKPVGETKLSPAQITARAKQRLLDEGGISITSIAIRDPELARKILDRVERLNCSKNDVVREALEFFFEHSET